MTKHIGFRGVILSIFGVFSLMFGLGSIGSTISPQALINAQVITWLAPLEYWYVFWTMTGIACFIGAVWKRIDPFAYGAFMFSTSIFALGYMAGQILDWSGMSLADAPVVRGWISALLFGTLALLGYIESRRP